MSPGWSISDFGVVGARSETARATMTCSSGTSALDGPVDVLVVTSHHDGVDGQHEELVAGRVGEVLGELGDQVELPAAEVGDLIAVFCAGAYGLTASPQAFLSQTAAQEMMV